VRLTLNRGGAGAATAVLPTPPEASGLLPGVLREEMLNGGAEEAGLRPADFERGELFVGNALRGLAPARPVG
jgi:4-amino-4-deoxychorismate lyase